MTSQSLEIWKQCKFTKFNLLFYQLIFVVETLKLKKIFVVFRRLRSHQSSKKFKYHFNL
jgi:hypothetical protein